MWWFVIYYMDWRLAPPTSVMGKTSPAFHWMLPGVMWQQHLVNPCTNFPTLQNYSQTECMDIFTHIPPLESRYIYINMLQGELNPSRVTSGQSPCWGPEKLRWLLLVAQSMANRTANAVVGASSSWGTFVGWNKGLFLALSLRIKLSNYTSCVCYL